MSSNDVTNGINNQMKNLQVDENEKQIPCRYFKWSTCKLGDNCRFLHVKVFLKRKVWFFLKKDLYSKKGDNNSSNYLRKSNDFLRRSTESSVSSTDSYDEDLENTITPQPISSVPSHIQSRFQRRPFLHIIVLFGADDSKVVKYSKDITQTFLDNGIDIYLQTKVDNGNIFLKKRLQVFQPFQTKKKNQLKRKVWQKLLIVQKLIMYL